MKREDVALVIIGYDPYKDVWDHYFELLNKYWRDRPQTYLVSNEIMPEYDDVKVYAAGKDAEWSKKVQLALEIVQEKYIILLLEDFFTTNPVKNEQVYELIDCMEENNLKYCKLKGQASKMKGEFFGNYDYLRIIDSDSEYGVSLQPSVWHRDFLKELVGKENYNAWIFEFNQVKNKPQNKEYIDCIADQRNILKITHTIVQSKYLPKAIKTFKRQGYDINLQARDVLSFSENFKYRLKCYISEIVPNAAKKFAKKIGRLIGVEFVSDRELGNRE